MWSWKRSAASQSLYNNDHGKMAKIPMASSSMFSLHLMASGCCCKNRSTPPVQCAEPRPCTDWIEPNSCGLNNIVMHEFCGTYASPGFTVRPLGCRPRPHSSFKRMCGSKTRVRTAQAALFRGSITVQVPLRGPTRAFLPKARQQALCQDCSSKHPASEAGSTRPKGYLRARLLRALLKVAVCTRVDAVLGGEEGVRLHVEHLSTSRRYDFVC